MRWSSFAATALLLSSLGATSSADLAPPKLVGKGPPKPTFVLPKVDTSDLDPVVVSVGSSSVRKSELEALLTHLHEFERRSYGSTPDEVKASFVRRRLVPELLAAEEAHQKGLDAKPPATIRIRDELVERLKDAIQSDIDAKLTQQEILDYCRTEGGTQNRPDAASTGKCSGELTGYRVALVRTRLAKAMSDLVEELRAKNVRGKDTALLASIQVDAKSRVSAAPAPAAQ
jgi:hypothetical protein